MNRTLSMTAKQRILLFPILLFSSACAPKLSAGELEEAAFTEVTHREEGELNSYVVSTYPSMTGPLGASQSALNLMIEGVAMEKFKHRTESLFRAAADVKKEMAADPELISASNYAWRTETTYFLGHLAESSVSLCFKEYHYSGGAHGNWGFYPINYRWDGVAIQEVSLHELFDEEEDWGAQLDELIWRNFVALLERADTDENYLLKMREDGEGLKTGVHEGVAFSYSSTGVMFYFAPYILASFAQGDFFVLVPMDEIEPLLDRDGPMRRWIGQ